MVIFMKKYDIFCDKGPFHVGFPITNRCNLKCKMCLRNKFIKSGKFDPKKQLSLNQVDRILRNLNEQVESINISAGYGEVFLHPNFIQIVRKIKKLGKEVIFFTNLTVNSKKKYKLIIKENIKNVIISLDYADKKKYELIREGAKYEDVIKNIELLVGCKKLNHSPTLITFSKIFFPSDTFKDILDLLNLATGIGIDTIELRDIFPENKNINFNKKINNKEKDFLFRVAEKNGISISFPKRHDEKSKIICPDLWKSLYFNIEGFVKLCCFNDLKTLNLNIFDKTIKEIWNSQELVDIRSKFLNGTPFIDCEYCPIRESLTDATCLTAFKI